ncbi:hypothetical protein SAMN02745857_01289 [Andreprevotia lacus DSM 23236]|uniref:Uncharacterized protein n=1 Tax=Andreprevotia lacus DSM 23236 TaxID=1121001 RepID=A0A1W1XEM3_9NEIS|nr:hypothetical protein [Andreprevotia lacus]SMC21941.1 hypothetical protein SAMN02745857_01289 [Andreprevotia lacus DSM 23236]
MKPPSFGMPSYPWLRELSRRDLELLDQGLCELLNSKPGAFSLFQAHTMRNAIQCVLLDKHFADHKAA